MAQPNYNLLNTNIPAEAASSAMKGMQQVNTLNSQRLANQASEMEMRNALAEQEAFRGAGSPQEAQDRLMKAGFGKQSLAIGTQLAGQAKTQAETKKLGLDITAKDMDIAREQYKNMIFNPSNANIQSHLEDQILQGRMTRQQAAQEFGQIANLNPEQRKQYFTDRSVKAEEYYKMNTVSAAQQQSNATAIRGQNMTQSTAIRGQDIGRIPVGYRMTPAGEIEPIPGGPTTTNLSPKEMQVREAKFPQANLAIKSFDAKSDSVLKDIEKLRNHPGLASITGIAAGRLPGVSAQGREALELYEKVVAGLQFQELQNMRNASPTGGALGNVSNQEGTQLRQAAGALSRVQEKGSVQNELDNIANSIQGSKSRLREAFDMTYDYKPSIGAKAAPAGGNTSIDALLDKYK